MKLLFSILVVTSFLFGSSLVAEDAPKAKSETRKEVDAALDKVESEINALESKTKELSKDARSEWQKAIDDLKNNGRKIRDDIKSETAGTDAKAKDYWARMKAAVNELSLGVANAAKKMKDKTEAKK